ncbi:MAG: threonylcarbamoyl-AMP synthase [Proteobacteria bacterium]|nr:threonylcarbamoyl-AMP synthase [Pseudomonadota bacterium]
MTVSIKHIRNAAHWLHQEQLVAFPTETVYGLGGNALSDAAVASIYAVKGRPQFNPLIVHVRSIEDAHHYGVFSESAHILARKFWPGPLTLVLPRREHCKLSLLVSAGLDTVAIRVPAHPLAQALLHESGLPIAAPSANRSGRVSPTEAAHVHEELAGRVAMVLDGGPCHVGIESTVLDLTGAQPRILRPGSITAPMLQRVLGHEVPGAASGEKILAPGMLASHYAPTLRVRLNATSVEPGEALLAFGPPPWPSAPLMVNLSAAGNLQEAAANLFRMLRRLDTLGQAAELHGIAVMPIPSGTDADALGLAINDRLNRAAAPR